MTLDVSRIPELSGAGVREDGEDVEELDAFDGSFASYERNGRWIALDGLLLHHDIMLDACRIVGEGGVQRAIKREVNIPNWGININDSMTRRTHAPMLDQPSVESHSRFKYS